MTHKDRLSYVQCNFHSLTFTIIWMVIHSNLQPTYPYNIYFEERLEKMKIYRELLPKI